MIILTFVMLIIAINNGKNCNCLNKYYEIISGGNPPLPNQDIISRHSVKHPVQIMCTFLCHNEPKCVGFNFRAQNPDENCQLTNSTKEENTINNGSWTLIRAVQAPPTECCIYTWLNESSRNEQYLPREIRHCDSTLSTGWYRFGGGAGTKLSTKCYSGPICGTTAHGWMSGAHPTVAEGKVSRKVCYEYQGDCCFKSNNIEVVNCGQQYYVYKLGPSPSCNLRYCGSYN